MATAHNGTRSGINTELIVDSNGPQAEREGLHTKGRKQQAPHNRKPFQNSVPAEGSLVISKDKSHHDQKEQQLSIRTTPKQIQGYKHSHPPFMLQSVGWQPQGPGNFSLWKYDQDSNCYTPHCFYHPFLGWCLPTFFVNPSRLDRWCLTDMQYGSAIIVSCDHHPKHGYAARVQVCMGPMNHPSRLQVSESPKKQPAMLQGYQAPKTQPEPPPRQNSLLGAWAKPLTAAAASPPSDQQQPKQSKSAKKSQRRQGKAAEAAAAVREAAAALKAQEVLAKEVLAGTASLKPAESAA